MSYTVLESAAASRDIDRAVSYMADTLKSPTAAKRFIGEYERAVSLLEATPLTFPLVRDDLLAFSGYRWISAGDYMLFFTVDEDHEDVNVERVAHSSQNWMQLLR